MRKFTKGTGPKPSKTVLSKASKFARDGTGDHMAVAMAMRPNGVTQQEVIGILGHPHRNIIKKLLGEEKVKLAVLPESGRSVRIKLTQN